MYKPEVEAKLVYWPQTTPDGVSNESSLWIDSSNNQADPRPLQTVALQGTEKPGYSAVYRNIVSPQKVIGTYHPHIKNLYDVFHASVKSSPDQPFLGARKYDPATKKWSDKFYYRTYQETLDEARNLSSAIVKVVADKAGRFQQEKYIVGMYLPNCPQWAVTDIACFSQSLASACMYDTLGPDTSVYIMELCESPCVVVDLVNLHKVLTLKPKLPKLKVVICSEDFDDSFDRPENPLGGSLKSWADKVGVLLLSWSDAQDIGKENPIADNPPSADDIYAINFTSGTTGLPKGAILTHKSVLGAVAGIRCLTKDYLPDHGKLFSFLPLAHIFERAGLHYFISKAFVVDFPHGSVLTLMEDIAISKPTAMNLVPRVLNRLAGVLKSQTIEAPGLVGALSRRAYAAKLDHLHKTGSPNHPVWDRLWSNKISKKLGFDNTIRIITGSAPLGRETIDFLKVALGLELSQGYGLTESMAAASVTQHGEGDSGSVGALSPGLELRFRDVPELNYLSTDKPYPRGEIMLRGIQIFVGYYKNNEKTDEAFDSEGWFHTGDVGAIDGLGRLYIVDRVKNFFKLSQGEYVAAEKIENIYVSQTSLINQIFVHGNSHESFLVALAAVNPDAYAPWLSHLLGKRITPTMIGEMNNLSRDPKIRKAFLKAINSSIPPGLLQGFEKVKNLHMAVEPMTIDNGCLTPTMKIVRNDTVKMYKELFDGMYEEGPLEESNSSKL